MIQRLGRILASLALLTAGLIGVQVAAAPASNADACYTWNRTLREGSSGSDVRQLQIRVAAYHGRGGLVIDGSFGPATKSALTRFQREYGLAADGIAGPQTYSKIYALQDADCTPAHFTFPELNKCNTTWSGGAVSASTAKNNALQVMWKLERSATASVTGRSTSAAASAATAVTAGSEAPRTVAICTAMRPTS